MGPILKTEKLIYKSKAALDEKMLLGKITHQVDTEIWKILVRGMFANKDSLFNSGP